MTPSYARTRLPSRPARGDLATCDMVRLELLYSARDPQEFADIRNELAALADCPITQDQWHRSLRVYEQLSARGGHINDQSSTRTC